MVKSIDLGMVSNFQNYLGWNLEKVLFTKFLTFYKYARKSDSLDE